LWPSAAPPIREAYPPSRPWPAADLAKVAYGSSRHQLSLGPFEENEPLAIEQQFATNVFGTFHVTRGVLPVMRQQRAGYILNVSAIGGLICFPGTSIYSSSKCAVEGFSKSLALEVSGFGIKVTIVEPGFIRTG
jgi:NAD(P)-dependent dehydrogenase (short-subunit alcohol dehydrogenase family)